VLASPADSDAARGPVGGPARRSGAVLASSAGGGGAAAMLDLEQVDAVDAAAAA